MPPSENLKSETALDIIKKWCSNSPSHGIRRISRAKTLIGSLFWVYIFWIFTILMSGFIYTVIMNYIAHPTKIHLSIRQYRDPDHFPSITFCNINPLQDDELLTDDRKTRLPGREPLKYSSEDEFRREYSAYIDRILADQVNGQAHPFVKWGFKLNDLLISCIFNKKLCDRNLTQFFHPDYGNCYTFDNNHHVLTEETNDIPHDWSIDDDNGDNNYKLFLELYLHQPLYNQYLDPRAAFRIFIHRKYEVPILSQNSLFLGPNKYTKLSFSQRIMSFSRQCRNELTDEMKQIFVTRHVRYTQALCYKICEHRIVAKYCECIAPTLAVFYQYFTNTNDNNGDSQTTTNPSLCSINDECLMSRKNFTLRESCAECLPECEIIKYSVQSSYANYPNVKAYNKVLQRVRNHFRNDRVVSDGQSTNRRTVLRDNIVAVEISASPYATEILSESPLYTWSDLISSIGGQTGLWIGISLLSLVEIIELLYLLLDHFYSYILLCLKK